MISLHHRDLQMLLHNKNHNWRPEATSISSPTAVTSLTPCVRHFTTAEPFLVSRNSRLTYVELKFKPNSLFFSIAPSFDCLTTITQCNSFPRKKKKSQSPINELKCHWQRYAPHAKISIISPINTSAVFEINRAGVEQTKKTDWGLRNVPSSKIVSPAPTVWISTII